MVRKFWGAQGVRNGSRFFCESKAGSGIGIVDLVHIDNIRVSVKCCGSAHMKTSYFKLLVAHWLPYSGIRTFLVEQPQPSPQPNPDAVGGGHGSVCHFSVTLQLFETTARQQQQHDLAHSVQYKCRILVGSCRRFHACYAIQTAR